MSLENERDITIGKLTEVGPRINHDDDPTIWEEWSLTYWWKSNNPTRGQNGIDAIVSFRLDEHGNIFYSRSDK